MPHSLQQFFARQYAARVSREVIEEIEFQLCQSHWLIESRHFMCVEIDVYPTEIERPATRLAGVVTRLPISPTQRGTHACEQFRQLKRFGQVVVGAGVESAHTILGAAACGEHDDGNVVACLAQLTT